MKLKELKNLAQKIAKNERIIQTSDDKKAVAKAKNDIAKLSEDVQSFEDMMILDELVMEILEKNS